MRDTDLYRQVLGLEEPWFVKTVDLKIAEQRVDILVEHKAEAKWPCPTCGKTFTSRDHTEERAWRHLDTCQFQTFLHARIPRIDCPEHGIVQVKVPWAEARSRFTLLFERLAIDVLQQCATIEGARRLLRLSWGECWRIMSRAVSRGQSRKKARPMPRIGVDEKAFRKGHHYMTLVSDIDQGTVEFVTEDRKQESLERFFTTLNPTQLDAIEAVAMDMWVPYVQAVVAHLKDPARKIVFDRFHIMRHVGDAVDKVRRQEHRSLLAEGDESLKGTKYMWLFSGENMPERYHETWDSLMDKELKVVRAWGMKETLRRMWSYHSEGWARKFFRKWFHWATHSRLEPMRRVAHLLKNHLDGIVTYCKHRITNAVAEGLNSKIMGVKRRACGYRNPEHFKIAIYFFCGGLDLYPH